MGLFNSGSDEQTAVCGIGQGLEWRMCKLKPQELANTTWAFATVRQVDEPLFAALARASEGRVCNFKPQNLANRAWAFATVGQVDETLFAALASASEGRMCNFWP